MANFIQEAFGLCIENAKEPEACYVCLVSEYQAYGGPEEGGWWQTISNLEQYAEFPDRVLAEEARDRVEALARELTAQERASYGDYCVRSLEWLDARGLDSDWMPEPDGETVYRVFICDEIPVYDNSRMAYE